MARPVHGSKNNSDELYVLPQQEKLDGIIKQVLETLQQGKNDIYEVSEDCRSQCLTLEQRLEEAIREAKQVVEQVDEYEMRYQQARTNLARVSKDFAMYSERDIQKAYQEAQDLMTELQTARQKEIFLKRRRDDLMIELRKFEAIAVRAERMIENTRVAITILEGNLEELKDAVGDAYKKQQLALWIMEYLEMERRKIARDLHDGPAQVLASILISIELISQYSHEDWEMARQELTHVRELGQQVLSEIRRIMYDLRPGIMDEEGLVKNLINYLSDFQTKYDIYIDFECDTKSLHFDSQLEIALFRILQEALTNARKHAGVNKMSVHLEEKDNHIALTIEDQGRGFEIEKVLQSQKESYGIIGMRERTELLNGKMEILSSPGAGTQIRVEVPTGGDGGSGEN